MEIADLKRTAPNEFCYCATMPDGRVLTIAKIMVNRFSQRRIGIHVRAVQAWGWEVLDEEGEVRSQELGMPTRKLAFERAVRWCRENPKGTVVATD